MNPFAKLLDFIMGRQITSPLADTSNIRREVWASPQPTGAPNTMPEAAQSRPGVLGANTDRPSKEALAQAIAEGFKNWGSPPAATLSADFARESQGSPIFDKYPFILAAISLLESGGGKHEKQPNNLLNWGINLPKGHFDPQSPQEVINKTATGLAGRTAAFEPFRKSLDLEDLARVYAPESDNPGTGGSNYARNLKSVMEVFQSKLK